MKRRNPQFEVARILLAERDARVAAYIRRYGRMPAPGPFDVSARVARLLRAAVEKGATS